MPVATGSLSLAIVSLKVSMTTVLRILSPGLSVPARENLAP